jgi:LysM repeat protein
LEFGRTRDGDFAVLTQAGTAFQSEDAGRSWKTLAVTRADREETTTAVHVVQAGDTVALIADIHGITVAALVEQNLLGDNGDSLTPGQELTITRKTVVTGLVSPVIPDPSMIRVSAPAEPEAPTEPTPPAPEPVAPTPPAPIPPPITPSQPGVTEYVVKAGDTLLRIARAHQTTVASLVSINGITNPNRIFVGQRLRLQPGPSATPAPTTPGSSAFPPLEPLVVRNAAKETTYVVKRGDSLLSIARAHDTTVSALVSLNSISNPNRIFVGQKLKIRSSNGQTRSFHRVQAGDTLPIIGQRRSIDVSELIRLNPKVPTSGDLKDGSLIRVS